MYNIRDNAIPNGLIEELKRYLEKDIFSEEILMSEIMETLYGSAISVNNIQIISLLNLFVRDNNIKIGKLKTIEEIYNADCRKEYKKYDCRQEFVSFSGKIREEYIDTYWDIFKK